MVGKQLAESDHSCNRLFLYQSIRFLVNSILKCPHYQVTFGLSMSLGHLCPNGGSQIEYLSSSLVEFSKI